MENDLFATVKTALQSRLESVLRDMLPGGKVQGREYVCGSISGGPGDSCKTNLKTGVGGDFAVNGQMWGDIIALTAVVMNCGQEEAARFLADEYHIDTDTPRKPARKPRAPGKAAKKDKAEFVSIMPIPDSAPDFPAQYRTGLRWCYRDADGMELCYAFRLDKPDGGKDFVPLCFCRDAQGNHPWKEMAPPAPRPLYGLDKLAKAAPDAAILLVEGEKTADAAQALFPEYVCMTWMGGSNATGKADFSPLAGRNVIVWPDNDAAGIKAAAELIGILYAGVAADVRIDHEQKRTEANRIGHIGAPGRGSERIPPEPGRKDPEHRNAGAGLRAAIDAVERIVTEFTAAYRRLEQYLAERRKTIEREKERDRRGMSR